LIPQSRLSCDLTLMQQPYLISMLNLQLRAFAHFCVVEEGPVATLVL
jgi:hypothetical protein